MSIDISKYIIDDRLTISVKPNSSKNEITCFDDDKKILKVNIRAPAENNKANIEVIKFFSKLTKKEVKIMSGFTAKKKVLRFEE